MSISALQAINAYAQATQSGQTSGIADAVSLAGTSKSTSGPDFGAMIQDAIGSTAASTTIAEKMMVSGAAGQSELIDVVTAVSQAEMQLQTVVSIRDQMIKAYQEIMRMPI